MMVKHNRSKLIAIIIATSIVCSGCGRPQTFSEFLETRAGRELARLVVRTGACEVSSYARYYDDSMSADDNLRNIQRYVVPCIQN